MRKVLLTLLLAFTSSLMFGQGFGVVLGLNSAKQKASWIFKNEEHEIVNVAAKTGLFVGLNYDFDLSDNLYFETGAAYSSKGSDLGLEWTVDYIEVPLVLKYKFEVGDNMYIIGNSGLYSAFAISVSKESSTNNLTIGNSEEDNIKPFDLGLQIGGGFMYDKYEFFIKYNHGLMDVCPRVDGDGWIYNLKNRVITFGVGYRFID